MACGRFFPAFLTLTVQTHNPADYDADDKDYRQAIANLKRDASGGAEDTPAGSAFSEGNFMDNDEAVDSLRMDSDGNDGGPADDEEVEVDDYAVEAAREAESVLTVANRLSAEVLRTMLGWYGLAKGKGRGGSGDTNGALGAAGLEGAMGGSIFEAP